MKRISVIRAAVTVMLLFFFSTAVFAEDLPVILAKDSIKVSGAQVYFAFSDNRVTGGGNNGNYVNNLKGFRRTVCRISGGKLTIDIDKSAALETLNLNYPVGDNKASGLIIHSFFNNAGSSINLEKDYKPVSFIYVDNDVTIHGVDSYGIMQFNNVSLKAGWNAFSSEWDGTYYVAENVIIDSGCRWFLHVKQ
ncbi:MAG: hypothetical protein FWC19_00965 [Treponema sp.]|nr:hypothetical protein [Treponema sp.]MCL2271363.1 hypothetical protein [Treponema sp.]